ARVQGGQADRHGTSVFEDMGERKGLTALHTLIIGAVTDGVKELTLSYINRLGERASTRGAGRLRGARPLWRRVRMPQLELAPRSAIRQILGVRWVGLLLCVVASAASAAPRASNPAFLGIQMMDSGGRGPCLIQEATRSGPAEAAGLRGGDRVLAVD